MARRRNSLTLRTPSPPKGALMSPKGSPSPKQRKSLSKSEPAAPMTLVRFASDEQLAVTYTYARVPCEAKPSVWYSRPELELSLREAKEALEDRMEEMGPNPPKHVQFDTDECTWRGLEYVRENINRSDITSEYVQMVLLARTEQLVDKGHFDEEDLRRQAKQWSKESRIQAVEQAQADAKAAGISHKTVGPVPSRASRMKRNMSGGLAMISKGFLISKPKRALSYTA